MKDKNKLFKKSPNKNYGGRPPGELEKLINERNKAEEALQSLSREMESLKLENQKVLDQLLKAIAEKKRAEDELEKFKLILERLVQKFRHLTPDAFHVEGLAEADKKRKDLFDKVSELEDLANKQKMRMDEIGREVINNINMIKYLQPMIEKG